MSINEFATSVSREKDEEIEGAVVGVSLSEINALSEYHPLNEASARLASQGESGRESVTQARTQCAISLSSESFVSSALSAPCSLSQKSLTRA